MTEEETVRVIAELRGKAVDRMTIAFTPAMAFQLAALMQLATRHPLLPAEPLASAKKFVAVVRAYFADCPTVLAVLDQGDDPTQDVPWPDQGRVD